MRTAQVYHIYKIGAQTHSILPVQIMFFDVENFTDFIRIRFEIDIFLQKQYVIDFMFAPYAIANIFVMDSGQIVEILWTHLQRKVQ